MSKIHLHIGTHKTGTTSIQKYMSSNTEVLHSLGLYYPNVNLVQPESYFAHHKLAHSIAGKGKKPWCSDTIRRFIDLSVTSAGANDVIISAEPFYRHLLNPADVRPRDLSDKLYWSYREAYIRKTFSYFADYDVNLVVVFRGQSGFLKSRYQENVKSNSFSGSPFELYLAKRNEFEYYQQVTLWNKYFKSINVGIYENLITNGSLIENFLESLVSVKTSGPLNDQAIKNTSIHPLIIEFKKHLKINYRDELSAHELRKLQKIAYQKKVISPDQAYSYVAPSEEKMIMAAHADCNQMLKKHYLSVNQPSFPDVSTAAGIPLNPAIGLTLDLTKKLHLYLTQIRGGK
jgi:hypothetical protein